MIYINEKLRISKLDERNLQIEEYRKGINPKTKQESWSWKWCGYYGDLKTALLGVLSKKLFDSTDEEIKLVELVGKIEEAREQIINAIKNKGEGNGDEARTKEDSVSTEMV